MTHIATKINCDGDKCGECEYQVLNSLGYLCVIYGKTTCFDNRLPECLAAELVEDCETCKHEHLLQYEYPCSKCNPDNINNWQPATKGER